MHRKASRKRHVRNRIVKPSSLPRVEYTGSGVQPQGSIETPPVRRVSLCQGVEVMGNPMQSCASRQHWPARWRRCARRSPTSHCLYQSAGRRRCHDGRRRSAPWPANGSSEPRHARSAGSSSRRGLGRARPAAGREIGISSNGAGGGCRIVGQQLELFFHFRWIRITNTCGHCRSCAR